MSEVHPAPRSGADPRAWLEAQGAYARDLAAFQAGAPSVSDYSMDEVLRAIQPAHKLGFSWSMSNRSEGCTITVRHVGGWEDASYLRDASSWPAHLALLLGVPCVAAEDRPDWDNLPAAADPAPEPAAAAQEEPQVEPDEFDDAPDLMGPGTPDGEVLPEDRRLLSDADKATAIALLKAMRPDERQRFTVAFRSHFNVDPKVKRISDHICQVVHQRFIADFIDELEATAA